MKIINTIPRTFQAIPSAIQLTAYYHRYIIPSFILLGKIILCIGLLIVLSFGGAFIVDVIIDGMF